MVIRIYTIRRILRSVVPLQRTVAVGAYKEHLNMPVVAERVAREQPTYLQDYFREMLAHYRVESAKLPKSSDPRYIQMAEANKK